MCRSLPRNPTDSLVVRNRTGGRPCQTASQPLANATRAAAAFTLGIAESSVASQTLLMSLLSFDVVRRSPSVVLHVVRD